MYIFISIIQTFLAGVFGWLIADIQYELKKSKAITETVTKSKSNFHMWKVWVVWGIYLSLFFTESYLTSTACLNKTYDTSKYEIVYGTDEMPTDSTMFKIIKK